MTTTPTAAARVSGTIKALEWRAHNDKYDGGRVHYGTGVFGHWYAINRARNREWMVVHHPGSKPHHLPPVASLDAAKAAAQADYESRILAAIQPDPEPQPVAWRYRPVDKKSPWSNVTEHRRTAYGRIGMEEQPLYATPSSAGTVIVDAAGWQPIGTAPGDGKEFLIAYSDGTVRAGRYLDNSHTSWPWKGVRPMYGAERADCRITHWMPLPKPPALRALAGEGKR